VNRIKRPNTWLHRPMLQNVKKALANLEPSTHGTKPTCRCSRRMSASVGGQNRHAIQAEPLLILDPKPTIRPGRSILVSQTMELNTKPFDGS
jgi:hypothetical protein